jgi:nucleoside-diphosphate-sugar epimerase
MAKTALVVGASGIVGSATASLLVDKGWAVQGLTRRPTVQPGVMAIAADLRDRAETTEALSGVSPDAVFITTWAREDSEAENIRVNSTMVRNLLDGLRAGEQGRLNVENFYYAQEDEVFAAAERDGFSWSVHRPHTVIGEAVGNAMNHHSGSLRRPF